MNCLLLFSLLWASILGDVWTAPGNRVEVDPELTGGYFEGDMMFSPLARNGLRSETYHWPNGIVSYYINSNIDQAHRDHIQLGMRIIELKSCLTFKEVSKDQSEYVNITAESGGCYTAVGYQRRVQQLNLETYDLDEGCYRLGTIMHEILHAVGFFHQQSTWNRDDFVHIATENIADGKEHNFEKYSENLVENFDQTYDYGSVMHYTPYGFSKNGEMTIVPLEEGAEKVMGQRVQMSQIDIDKLNIMYKCPKQI
ncbi:seminal metalloprotease 1-like [Drosophila nasuta]|uniref:seminal metalloprotease 1-like n=1 Tax=Drosophila nasuta TaxID=42062 RepID=UPI00295E40E0|nr:seminal metalloprotease 1-like [Drosophila nasuta]